MIETFDSEEHISAGKKLRNTRMDRGVTLDEVARITRITKAYLLALEEDAYEKLPSEAYARGFLRIYANFLRLPAEEVLLLYQRSASGETPEESVPTTACDKLGTVEMRTEKRWLWPVSAVCLAVFSGFFFLADKAQHRATTEKMGMQLSPATENAVAPLLHVPLSSAKRTENLSQNLTVETDIPATDSQVAVQGIVLKMRALEDGYLNLTIDEAITQHYNLKAGDLIEWKADKVFSLDMENAGGVEAELNGKLLKPFGEKGAPAHIVLSAGYNGEKTER
jgi:cytoskeleton protein RodZ